MSFATAAAAFAALGGDPGCYLVDFACYKPEDHLRVDAREMEEHAREMSIYTQDRRDFMWKVYIKSGLGPNATFLPESCHFKYTKEPRNDVDSCLMEGMTVMTGAVDELLSRLDLDPKDVDILLTSNSIFSHTPSLASMLVNHYGMRTDVVSYHCGGMGCSNGTLGVGLARDLLKAHPNSVCLLVFSEILTHAFYLGNDKSRMVANVIFRMGGAAALLSNRPDFVRKAKYRLEHCVRVSTAARDESFRCVHWGPDASGFDGMYLDKNIIREASICLEQCIRMITPKIMTWGQYAEAAAFYARQYFDHARRRLLGGGGGGGSEKLVVKDGEAEEKSDSTKQSKKSAPPPSAAYTSSYLPDYSCCVDHFLIHAGGYSVLKGLQEGMRLSSSAMIPSYASLRDYGNTSASTTWYAFGYTEACQGVRKGDRVLQMGVGGGMKGGVNTWRALRDIDGAEHVAWQHLEGKPISEADLPRGVDIGDIRNHQEASIVREIEEREKREILMRKQMAAAAADSGDGLPTETDKGKGRMPTPKDGSSDGKGHDGKAEKEKEEEKEEQVLKRKDPQEGDSEEKDRKEESGVGKHDKLPSDVTLGQRSVAPAVPRESGARGGRETDDGLSPFGESERDAEAAGQGERNRDARPRTGKDGSKSGTGMEGAKRESTLDRDGPHALLHGMRNTVMDGPMDTL